MPTPYGSRGGLAFGAEELRVLRRALALALHPSPVTADDVQDCLRLAASLDEATRESARLRAFLVADLGRYRAALPGTAIGYLALLEEALGAGYRPQPDDLAALRALRGNPTAAALLRHCERVRLTALPGGLSAAGQEQEREREEGRRNPRSGPPRRTRARAPRRAPPVRPGGPCPRPARSSPGANPRRPRRTTTWPAG